MSETWKKYLWCPLPEDDGVLYRWTISFEADGEWIRQSVLLGGPPDGADLEQLLRTWFQRRGGPGARWRLQVSQRDDDQVITDVELQFDEHTPLVQRPRRARAVYAPPCWAPEDA